MIDITDIHGNVTDTFKYDTYGKQISRTGTSYVIFGYNGRDGVVTDKNGLIYMRARYYSPDMKRFVNADIVAGKISNAVTLNRYAYANGNPVSNIDPFGLSAERGDDLSSLQDEWAEFLDYYDLGSLTFDSLVNDEIRVLFCEYVKNRIKNTPRPKNIGVGIWKKQVTSELKWVDDVLGEGSKISKGLKILPWVGVAADTAIGMYDNINNNESFQETATDMALDVGIGALGIGTTTLLSSIATSAIVGTALGTAVPGIGNVVGAVVGIVAGIGFYVATEKIKVDGEKNVVEWLDDGIDKVVNKIAGWFR